MLMYLMPKQELVRGLGFMILYRFLHFQDLRSMEKTSRWDGTAGDVKRMVSTGVYMCQGGTAMWAEGQMPVWEEQESLVKGAQVIKFKDQWKTRPLIISLLRYYCQMLLCHRHTRQWKTGQIRATTPCNFILSNNLLKAICLLSSHFRHYQFLWPPLLYPPSGLQSISWSSYLFSIPLIPSFISYFYSTFQCSPLTLPLPSFYNFILSKILPRLSVCFLFTSDSIIFSAHSCSTLLADCSLYCGALIFSHN